ncbi:MAG: HAD hydrolase family protein [Clostridia bacterium]|nr:HAD hydrolase family protein [Clostridia bacterium]
MEKKLEKIKALFMDVDGTLTDGHIYMSDNGEMCKAFHSHDGYGIKNILPKTDVVPVIITGRDSKIVARRAAELGISKIYQGVDDKAAVMQQLFEQFNITSENAAYIGDDFNDANAMELCGFTACPGDAVEGIKQRVDHVCKANGGRGAVREVIDLIAQAKENR